MPRKKKETSKTKSVATRGAFNLFESDIVSETQEMLAAMTAKKKNRPVTIKSMADVKSYLLPLDNLALQAVLGIRGLRGKTVCEIIGAEGIGKTTLLLTIIGALMEANQSPALLVNTEGENKLPNLARIKRSLHTNPVMAEKILNVLEIDTGRELVETTEYIENFLVATRKYLDDRGATETPIILGIDTLSKLMSPDEAAGFLDDDSEESSTTTAKKKQRKELGGGSNFQFPKLLHFWCRRLPTLLEKYNAILLVISHQNAKIDMSGFGSPMSADVSAGYNKTKRGGSGLNQNAAIQCTLKRTGFAKGTGGEVIGHKVQLRVVKSSVGADNQTMDYVLKTRGFTEDTEDYQEPSLDFSEGYANMLVANGLLGTKVSRKRYSSKVLGVDNLTSQDFMKALHERPDLVAQIGYELGIEGYLKPEWVEGCEAVGGEDDPEPVDGEEEEEEETDGET